MGYYIDIVSLMRLYYILYYNMTIEFLVRKFILQEERYKKEKEAREKALAQDLKNVELLALEEQQFQEYANKVIEHCEKGGRNTYPLKKAAQTGIGGGQGPVYNGKLVFNNS